MIRFYQERFLEAFNLLRQVESELEFTLADPSKSAEAFPSAVHVQRAKFALEAIELQCGLLELRTPSELAATIKKSLHADSQFFAPPSVKEMLAQLKLFKTSMQSELERRLFMYVPIAKAAYWQTSGPFPKSFLSQRAKDTQWEMNEAGNCYAAGRDTACVFHLMRAAEHSLRMLARRLRVTLTHSGKTVPIEFADWNKIITGIKNRIADAHKLRPGPKRQAKLETYSGAADHCEYMKELWRNNVAHARKPYTPNEAIDAFEKVRNFIQFLSKALLKE
jgi:hypothetical protein